MGIQGVIFPFPGLEKDKIMMGRLRAGGISFVSGFIVLTW
ncbi:hypothetical protein B4099_3473 [Heyndrickxia coagulans]|uniref:Uncharacterized protein n=1 Tax=Heyndrickxia coagulans TaxID=1398 RepID=A0A150K8F9_HEYCO|nr:hypothetical protein B4099_3473 [Heyndrickxia coagulans]